MKKHFLLFSLLIPALFGARAGRGQAIQWASDVEEYSTEFSKTHHAASKVIGSPNSNPAGGDSPDAWEPKAGSAEYIRVKFEKPMPIQRVVIVENQAPGAITKVTAIDKDGKPHDLKTYKPFSHKEKARILLVDLPAITPYAVSAIRVELDAKAVAGDQQIDAIGISDQLKAVSLIHLAPDLDVNTKPERLSEGVNTQATELGPVISPDGSTLFFSRRGTPQNIGGMDDKEDIWVSRRTGDGRWGPAQNLGKPLNNESYNFLSSVTPDGNTYLLGNVYLPNGDMTAGASLAHRQSDGTFSAPEPVLIHKDKNKNERVDYALSASGKIMIISEERQGTMGMRDLYVSMLGDNGEWSMPMNLGNHVNTASDDYAPFLAADERSLYYSTSGRPGYGGDDIFLVRRVGDGWDKWTEPENLGQPINSPGKDAYFTLPASGQYAYYTSAGMGKDETDIYRIVLPKSQRPRPVVLVSGRVLDKKTGKPVAAEIIYEDLTTARPAGSARSDGATGHYEITLPGGQNFGYVGQADGYFGISSNLDLTSLNEYKEITQDLYMAPREIGAVVRLNNLFFDFNKAELKPQSFPELTRVVRYMKADPKLELEIDGHTDSIASDAFNMDLSRRRAEAVVNYLTGQGVPAARLTAKAWGESKPIADNGKEEGRAINRRVEFVVRKL